VDKKLLYIEYFAYFHYFQSLSCIHTTTNLMWALFLLFGHAGISKQPIKVLSYTWQQSWENF